jgi:hypothetical protein
MDGRLADVQLGGNAGFCAVLPEELIEEPAPRFRELSERSIDRVERRSSGVGTEAGSCDILRGGWRDSQGIPPLLPIACERLGGDARRDEAGQRDAARWLVV